MTVYHVRRADVSGQRQRGRSRRGLPGISPTRAWLPSSGANFPHDGTRFPPLGARVASSRGRTFVGAPPPRGTPRPRRAYWSFQWTLWTLVDTLRERAWAVHWGKLRRERYKKPQKWKFFPPFVGGLKSAGEAKINEIQKSSLWLQSKENGTNCF